MHDNATVVVISGWTGNDIQPYTYDVEVVDVTISENILRTCPRLVSPFPEALEGASASFFGGKIRVCGGLSLLEGKDCYSDCYEYQKDADNWEFFDSLSIARAYAGSSVIDERLWLLSGGSGDATTDIVDTEGSITPGPPLPFAMRGHCQVTVNATQVFIVDAHRGGTRNSFLFNIFTGEYEELDPIPATRHHPACGLFFHLEGNHHLQRVVTVAGDGTSINFYLDDTAGSSPMTWNTLRDMPNVTQWLTSVQLTGNFLLVGGNYPPTASPADEIYTMEPGGCNIYATQYLKIPRCCAAAVAVPDNYFTCSVINNL